VLSEWAVAFFFTQLFELPIYWRASRSLKVGFLASAITHPVVWFVFPLLMRVGVGYWPMVALAECFAVGVETGWLAFNGVKRPFLWSLTANAVSVSGGFIMRELVGFP
jgi:hypothetical protein